MPFDRFGIKYLYPSKVGGYNWEQDDKPQKQSGVDWPDEMSFPSDGVVRMDPNGPTDWGIGKNIEGFSDSIGGCSMDFKETAARGYAYKKDDARDVEIKLLIKATNLGDHGFSISACTGHHKSGGKCCQGFAYMITNELGANPYEAIFRKEEWHVHYTPYPPNKPFGHSSMNFKVVDRSKWTGLGFCRYNDPSDVKKKVVVEAWVNPDPEADLNNWIMIKRFVDFDGAGWGDACDDCGGVKDTAGVWSNAQNRFKTNATSGYVTAKCITLREIDPSLDFSTTPPSGGGATVTRTIYYGAISSATLGASSYVGYGRTTSHEIVETQTDPHIPDGWWDDATGNELSDDNPTGGGQLQYPSGLWVDWYWSNSDKNNVIPGLNEVDKGSSTRMTRHKSNGRLLPTPQVFLVFWGTQWRDRTTDPTMTHIVNDVQNLLLGTNSNYFSKLSQYGCGVPTWGGSCVNVTTPTPDLEEDVSVTDIQNVLTDTFNRGLLALPGDDEDKMYLVYIPYGGTNTLVLSKSLALGWHGFHKFTLLATPNTTPPGSGGGGGTGGGTGSGTGGTPSVPIKVTGSFTIQRDLNIYRTSSCQGSSGGGGSGGSSKFFSLAADEDKELSNTDKYDNRTRAAARLKKTHAMKGSILHQLDVPLKKVGSPSSSARIYAKIWDSNNGRVFVSPTSIDPSTLTTSYVTKSYDFSGNTHPFVIGDRVGVEYITSSSTNYVVVGYDSDITSGAISMVQWEDGTTWDEKTSRNFACTMWD